MFYKKAALINFALFSRKHLCCSAAVLKRVYNTGFPVNIAKILRTPTLKNICKLFLPLVFAAYWYQRFNKNPVKHLRL